MKEKYLIEAIQSATKTAQSGGFDDARAERDALNYLIGFLRDDHPGVSRALDKMVSTCSALRVAKKVNAA